MSASEAETVCTLVPIEAVSWMVTRYSELKKMGACWFLMMVTFTTAWLEADRGGWPWSLKLILICTAEKENCNLFISCTCSTTYYTCLKYIKANASIFDITQIIHVLWRIGTDSFLAVISAGACTYCKLGLACLGGRLTKRNCSWTGNLEILQSLAVSNNRVGQQIVRGLKRKD